MIQLKSIRQKLATITTKVLAKSGLFCNGV